MSNALQGPPSVAAPKPPGLLDDGAGLVNRLSNCLHQLESMNDTLHGPQPRDASASPPDPQPSIRRHIDKAHMLIGQIEDEIQRMNSRL